MPIIETERLELMKITTNDAPFIFTLMNDPDWHRYIGNRGINTIEDAHQYITNKMIPSYEEHGFGFYIVRTKRDLSQIGICGLVNRENLEHIDIGFAFLPEARGFGYAFESSKALFDYAKKELHIERIAAITMKGNKPSIQLIEKLGLKFEKMIQFPGDSKKIMLFISE